MSEPDRATGTRSTPVGRPQTARPTLRAAWQGALAGEHRAVFGYGLIGAHLRSTAHVHLALTCSDEHETLRAHTRTAIVRAGWTPVAPEADYPSLYPVGGVHAAITCAVRLEQDCADRWRALYAAAATRTGSAADSARHAAQQALSASAVRATRWRRILSPARATVAFPGLPPP